uniref:Golgin subfamily A member 1 n=1 Tax=Amphiprion ocellaris TaxID=80972 RepID=A0AAQ5ZIP7_AMPOC
MFAKLKKKIAEEAATAPKSGVRIPRTISKESITSVGADSGDDFASDGSSSRDDLPAQLLRRNDQIRKLEAKLSDYAEQLRIMQKTKDKLEIALERHQDSSIKKLQDQNESHQASRAKMAEGMTLALEKKDQEWMEKMASVEKEKAALSARLEEMMEQSLALFQKRDDLDELEGFQQQELAKVKHMLLRKEELLSQREQEIQQKEADVQSAKRGLAEARRKLQALEQQHEESCRLNSELEIDFKDEKAWILYLVLNVLAIYHQAAVTEEDKERLLVDLQKKVTSLERRLQGNLSQDEHLQELLQEKSSLWQSLEETRAELLAVRTNHADTVSSLETQVNQGIYTSVFVFLNVFPQAELNSRQTVSTEIAKALEETRRQKEELQTKISYLEVEVETLTEQLHSPEVCEEDQNGSVTMDDLDHIQKVNRELEQQLSDKNRTIKQLQQRLAELKRTLQKELKIKPEPEAEGKEKFPPTSNTTVTNTSDLNDSREINFEYLKHVVLKFMSSREAEAYQLIRAVSVLLNFTREEEDMLKQTLEYKMSWFGSKPSPKGIIRPSISGTSTHWS